MKQREAIKYSIVIPVYNGEKTLETCLIALENQTVSRNEYEIIVVDDGSTDSSGKLAKAGADHYFYQENQGPAAARNLGAQKASGNIILFTDSDCEPTEQWIEQMVQPFQANPDVVGVKGAYLSKQKEIMARFVQIEYESRYEFMKQYQYIDFIDTYAAAYKREIFMKFGGFDSDFPIAMTEDTELSYRIAAAGHKMIFTPEAIVYHHHPTSFLYYMKRKYRAAYWRMLAVRKNRDKIKGDTHTPNDIKYQILSLPIIILGLIVFSVFGNYILLLISVALFLMTCWPFVRCGIKKDAMVSIISPTIIGVRTIVYIFGLSLGVWRFLLKNSKLR
jgi:cellulose synthase/poly-beta-1,6-N-acetylglucosamine synthase-like glycosyltransferase